MPAPLSPTSIFKQEARKFQKDTKLYLNKEFMTGLDIKNWCWEVAQQFLKKDFEGLEDAIKRRSFILETFGKTAFDLFYNRDCETVLDHVHALLSYYYIRSSKDINTKKATGLLYYIAGEHLEKEFKDLINATTNGIIAPVFDTSPKKFSWKRCNHILRKYILYFTKSEGYNAYYYEIPNFAQLAYLSTYNKSLEGAKRFLKDQPGGIFYKFLDKAVENRLTYAALDGQLVGRNGVCAPEYQKAYEQLRLQNPKYYGEDYSVYTEFVKPIMIEQIGTVMSAVLDEIKEQGFSSDDAYIYHVSPYRFGILIKDSLDMKQILPKTGKQFKPVVEPSRRDLVFGLYL